MGVIMKVKIDDYHFEMAMLLNEVLKATIDPKHKIQKVIEDAIECYCKIYKDIIESYRYDNIKRIIPENKSIQ